MIKNEYFFAFLDFKIETKVVLDFTKVNNRLYFQQHRPEIEVQEKKGLCYSPEIVHLVHFLLLMKFRHTPFPNPDIFLLVYFFPKKFFSFSFTC